MSIQQLERSVLGREFGGHGERWKMTRRNLDSVQVIGQPHMGTGEKGWGSSDPVKQLAIQHPCFEITGSALQTSLSRG